MTGVGSTRIRHCGATGGFSLSSSAVVEGCTARSNTGIGIGTVNTAIDEGSVITGCTAIENTSDGIRIRGASTITGCIASNNVHNGILMDVASGGNGVTVIGSTASGNGMDGIKIDAGPCTILDCTAMDNDSGIHVGSNATGTITRCTASDNGIFGIHIEGTAHVSKCHLSSNVIVGIVIADHCTVLDNVCEGHAGVLGAGIDAPGARNRIEGNHVAGNLVGIRSSTAGSIDNLIIRNSATSNTTEYDISAVNSFGPIVDVSAASDISAVTGADHPWANFVH